MKIKFSKRTGRGLSVALMVTVIMVIILASLSFANVRETITPDSFAPIYADCMETMTGSLSSFIGIRDLFQSVSTC